MGFVVADVYPGHPDFGKAIPCKCKEEERRQRRLKALAEMGGNRAIERLTFASFLPEGNGLSPDRAQNLRRAYDAARAYALEPHGWLLLTGGYGSGKTHLAAAIANHAIVSGDSAIFMVAPDLLDHLRAAFSPSSETGYDSLFEQVRNTPMLVLDDLGAQSSTPWAMEKMYQLLNHRYNLRLPTVITTNQRLEEMEPRIRSRLQDIDLVQRIAILAPDFRTGAAHNQADLSTLGLHTSQRFDTFNLRRGDLTEEQRATLERAASVAHEFAQMPRGWLVLSGTYGVGKTHLAAAVANYQVEHARADVMFVVVPDLLDYLRASFGPQSNISLDRRFDDIKKTPILILDDLGTESATPWAREKLFQLLNYRYDAMLPTVITTSQSHKEIDPRLLTRMDDVARCQFIGISATGYRGSGSQRASTRTRK